MENCILNFKSLNDAIKFAEKKHDPDGSSIRNEFSYWTDNYGFMEFIHDFREFRNKKQINPRLDKLKEYLSNAVEINKSHFIPQNIFNEQHDIAGDIVDIGRFVENLPECMIRFADNTNKKAINLVFQLGASASESDLIELTGEIIYCLGQILANRMINIYGYFNNSNVMHILIPLINGNSLAVAPQLELVLLNLKAFFRRILFAHFESANASIRRDLGICENGGYGQTVTIKKDDLIEIYGIKPDILINADYFDNQNLGDYESICNRIVNDIIHTKILT